MYNLPNTKVHSDDYVFVFFKEEPFASATENWLYMRTDIAEEHRAFIPLFQDLEMENVVERKEDCPQISEEKGKQGPCYRQIYLGERVCIFDEGADRCYWSYGNSRVMFDRSMFPTVIKGSDGSLHEVPKERKGVTDELPLNYIFLLTRDEQTAPVKKLNTEEAVKTLHEGKYTIRPGAGSPEQWGKAGYEPFYNPYPAELNVKGQEELFRRLFDSGVSCYLLNTGSYRGIKIPVHRTHMYIRHLLEV